MSLSAVLCSECFVDWGLKRTAEAMGVSSDEACPNCGSTAGKKLDRSGVEDLIVEFFWNGSLFRADFGGANRLASNPYHQGKSDVTFPPWVDRDARLIEGVLGVGLFHYGPALWRIGEIVPLIDLREVATRHDAAAKLISQYPSVTIDTSYTFFRLRTALAPNEELLETSYDAPPDALVGNGRLDQVGFPVLYGSDDPEVCFHECRVTVPDECFIAVMRPTKPLRLVNLCVEIEDGAPTPFDSINLALRFLFSAEGHSYEMTRAVAQAAKEVGYDGLLYPSYFSALREGSSNNIGIFGRPLRDKRVELINVNRAWLRGATYRYRLGPIFS